MPYAIHERACAACGRAFSTRCRVTCSKECRSEVARRSASRDLEQRFMALVAAEPNTGCWLWMGYCTDDGYAQIKMGGRHGANVAAHRVAYELFVGPIPDELQVCHSCDVRPCVNPAHLWLGTNLDNRRDSVEKRRHPYGERCHSAKLTPADVRVIRDAVGRRLLRDLAAEYGVSMVAISKIQRRVTWKHVA